MGDVARACTHLMHSPTGKHFCHFNKASKQESLNLERVLCK